MRRSRYSEEQISTSGAASFRRMEVSGGRKLKALEDENRKLKKLLAKKILDVSTLREMLGKNF